MSLPVPALVLRRVPAERRHLVRALVRNAPEATTRVVDAFRRHFSADHLQETGPTSASEDFGSFGTECHVPSVFWFIGGTDPDVYAKAKEAGRLAELIDQPISRAALSAQGSGLRPR